MIHVLFGVSIVCLFFALWQAGKAERAARNANDWKMTAGVFQKQLGEMRQKWHESLRKLQDVTLERDQWQQRYESSQSSR